MPMTWDAAADAKLFTVVMAVYDIKISGAQNERIAQMMGDDCTSKAITHRLSKIRNTGATHTPSPTISTPGPSMRKGHAAKFFGTPSKTGKGKGKDKGGLSATHTITTIMRDDGGDDAEDFSTPTAKSKGKKRKIELKEEDEFEDLGDAIDFNVGSVVGKKGGVEVEDTLIDLTDQINDDETVLKVKKEVFDDEDEDQSVI